MIGKVINMNGYEVLGGKLCLTDNDKDSVRGAVSLFVSVLSLAALFLFLESHLEEQLLNVVKF